MQPKFCSKWKTTLKKMQPRTIKSKNNNIFENRGQHHFFLTGGEHKTEIIQPKTSKRTNNGCGTSSGNPIASKINVNSI
jgi:hypothetical protein